jgi:hypothetical protein
MIREQATKALSEGKSIKFVSRDATLSGFTRRHVWLDADGDLVRSHPTRDVGTILVRDEDLSSLQFA